MAKVHVDRLADRLGLDPEDIRGFKYQALVAEVLAQGSQNVKNALYRRKASLFEAKRLGKVLLLPSLSEVVPKRSVEIIKAADKGKLITKTMREGLNRALRSTLEEFTATGKNPIETRTGPGKGKMNMALVRSVRSKIGTYFEGRAEGQIRNIAVTETRHAVEEIKRVYYGRLASKNPNYRISKKWIQTVSASDNPRRGHSEVHGKTISIDASFNVPVYVHTNKRWVRVRVDQMLGPHDPSAPADQVIGCSCQLVYTAEKAVDSRGTR